jgi:transcriptional regulator GlxA family with amidase domain
LARFFSSARAVAPTDGDSADLRPVHAEVRAALAWLEQNHARPDALDAFYEALAMSPNHFRRLFREATRSTVQESLSRMRLRRARHLVNHTAWPLKRIAVECGYRDPLFFSRQYRRFWGHPPRADRGRKTVA